MPSKSESGLDILRRKRKKLINVKGSIRRTFWTKINIIISSEICYNTKADIFCPFLYCLPTLSLSPSPTSIKPNRVAPHRELGSARGFFLLKRKIFLTTLTLFAF